MKLKKITPEHIREAFGLVEGSEWHLWPDGTWRFEAPPPKGPVETVTVLSVTYSDKED